MKRPLHIPKYLSKGDTLALFAPAGQLHDAGDIELGVKILREMGFEVKLPRSLWPGTSYLADRDEKRIEEFHKLLADPEVHGLIAVRGGYGCLRMVAGIDYQFVRCNPKVIMGFSDITVLLAQLVEKAGILCFHGPVVTSLGQADKQTLEKMYHSLTGHWHCAVGSQRLEIIRSADSCSGRIMGGNLSSLVTLLSTNYDFSWKNKIIFLEDVHEPLYKVDRMLTQLHLAGRLKEMVGLVLGDFCQDNNMDPLEKMRYSEAIWNRVCELVGDRSIPIWANFPLGHCPTNLTIPVGCMATMDHNTGKLLFQAQ